MYGKLFFAILPKELNVFSIFLKNSSTSGQDIYPTPATPQASDQLRHRLLLVNYSRPALYDNLLSANLCLLFKFFPSNFHGQLSIFSLISHLFLDGVFLRFYQKTLLRLFHPAKPSFARCLPSPYLLVRVPLSWFQF